MTDAQSRSGLGGWLAGLRDDMDRVTKPGQGWKVLTQLFLTYFLFCKSLSYGLYVDSYFPIMKTLIGVKASDTNDLYVVARAPWAMKPIWAIISDVLPIQGYRKRYYILIAVSLAAIGLVYPALITPRSGQECAFWFFLFVAGTTICDSMTQARYTELMKAAGNASVVNFVWFLISACGLLAFYNLLLPDSAETDLPDWRYKILLWLAVPCCVPMLYPAAMNWLAEEQGEETRCVANTAIIKKHPRIFVLAAVTATIALGGVVVQLSFSSLELWGITARWYNGFYYCGAAVVILLLCQVCLPRSIALPCVYMFICKAWFLNVGLILQYWYTAPKQCFDDAEGFDLGPEFEVSYYQMISGYGGTLASLAGVIIFDRTIQFWNVRAAFWFTTAVNALTTIFELMIVERWNQRLFGYDPNVNRSTNVDRAFFILGAQAIDKLLDMLDSLPQTVLIGKLCPRGMEAQVFAILAALSNFGSNVAYINGSIVAQVLGVKLTPPSGDNPNWICDNPPAWWGISSLGWLKLFATFFLPLATVPFTWCFLPNVNLNDDMLGEEDEQARELDNMGGGSMPEGAGQSFTGKTSKDGGMSTTKSKDENMWTTVSKGSLVKVGGSQLF